MLESHCNRSKLKAALSLPLKPRYSSAGTLPAALIKPLAITVPTHLHNRPFQMKGLVSDLHQHDPTRGWDIKCLKWVFEVVYLLQHEAARKWEQGTQEVFSCCLPLVPSFRKNFISLEKHRLLLWKDFHLLNLKHITSFSGKAALQTHAWLCREQGVEEHPVPATASPSSTQSCSVVPSSHEQRKWGRIFFFSPKKRAFVDLLLPTSKQDSLRRAVWLILKM